MAHTRGIFYDMAHTRENNLIYILIPPHLLIYCYYFLIKKTRRLKPIFN
jgi:hypothetical protein